MSISTTCDSHLSKDGKHCGCSNVTCGRCGSAYCCWCGDLQPDPNITPCEDCLSDE